MTEMELLTRLREEVPLEPVSARAERLFLAGSEGGRGRRAMRPRPTARAVWRSFRGARPAWQIAVAGGLSAALAAGVAAVTVPNQGPAAPAGGRLTVNELAYRASAAAARQPDVRPGQWVYRNYLTVVGPGSRRSTVTFWTTANSLRAAWVGKRRVHFFSGLASLGIAAALIQTGPHTIDGFGPWPNVLVPYRDLGSLPRNPRALDRYLAHRFSPGYGSPAYRDFEAIDSLLTAYVMPPRLTAELYRALADIPGVAADPHAVDVAGRPGAGFELKVPGLPGAGRVATFWIIVNPRTFRLMGDKLVIPAKAGQPGRAPTVAGVAILKEALAPGPGVRP